VLGTLPFVFLMIIAVVLLCVFPEIATAIPDYVYRR
jgi:C4-dicarboxylate transporter DctM subunit